MSISVSVRDELVIVPARVTVWGRRFLWVEGGFPLEQKTATSFLFEES